LKIGVAAAALATFAPDTRLRTTVRYDPAGGGTLWLVGAGDPTLTAGREGGYPAPARLADLARQVHAAGISTVSRVVGDGSVFYGPPVAPGWRDGYVTEGNVAPVSGLEVDGGRSAPGAKGARSRAPDLAAAESFALALRAEGVAVAATGTGRAGAGAGGAAGAGAAGAGGAGAGVREVAAVQSPPVPVLVEKMLLESDNDVAESLGRLVARKRGLPASFDGATHAVLDVLAELGVPTTGSFLVDVSGLSINDRIPPVTLVALLRTAALPGYENLRPLLTGLPVAGFSGTLADRFRRPEWSEGAGEVRAKTGSLRIVTSLAGQVVDVDRRLLFFAFLAPVQEGDLIRAALDRAATALASCGCPAGPAPSPPWSSPSAPSLP
jgi:D-alanyl-D-alanine carboxypeptidase/D-alanyl-D-alanine-endopeptidase (penicillin-binding protein 4)